MRRYCLLLLAIMLGGCGAPADEVVPVEGVIKINGQPAGNLQIQFNPIGKNKTSTALSDAQGRFKLMVGADAPGAIVGKHKVTVWDNRMTEDEGTKPGSKPAQPNRIPNKFMDVASTPIEIEVSAQNKDYTVDVVTKQ